MKNRLIGIMLAWFVSLALLLYNRYESIAAATSAVLFIYGLWLAYQLWESDKQTSNWQDLANRDELTGLLNRRGLLTASMTAPYALLMLDIDNFKNINDTHGHAIGDAVLKHLADNLTQHSRHGDICARWGGDEFIVLLTGANRQSAKNFLARLNKQLPKENQLPKYTFSVGCTDTHDTVAIDKLIHLADMLLLKNKSDR